jgi:hypothetical protein
VATTSIISNEGSLESASALEVSGVSLKARCFPPQGWELRLLSPMSAGRMQPPLSQVHGAYSVRNSRVRKGHSSR